MRIVSLVPSITELVVDLGLEKNLIGVTKFCVHPNHLIKEKVIVGGTKNLRLPVIEQLKPDLIIANKEENTKEQILVLQNKNLPVWVTDVRNLQDNWQMILDLGQKTAQISKSQSMAAQGAKAWQEIKNLFVGKVMYLIWQKPYMSVGNNTFIGNVMQHLGWESSSAKLAGNYPTIDFDCIKNSDFDLLLLSSEPYPFKEKHQKELQAKLPNKRVVLVNGEMFSWYGSRMLQAPFYFKQLKKNLNLL